MGYRIDNYGKTIIGKYINTKSGPKRKTDYFLYYLNSQKRTGSISIVGWGGESSIGKFYYMKYLDDYPNVIHPINKEVTDTLEILRAGFSREDIIGKKVNKIDYFP